MVVLTDLLLRIPILSNGHMSWFVHCTFDVMGIGVSFYGDLLSDICLNKLTNG